MSSADRTKETATASTPASITASSIARSSGVGVDARGGGGGQIGLVVVLGEIALAGPAAELARDARVVETYLGSKSAA